MSELVHTPPEVLLDNVVVPVGQTVKVPVIGGKGGGTGEATALNAKNNKNTRSDVFINHYLIINQ
jgi:hypothetical protein